MASCTPGRNAPAFCLSIEDIECPQADIKDFILIESDFVTHSGGVSISAAGPPVAADASLASASNNPAARTALVLRFRFEACFARDMVFDQMSLKIALAPIT